MLIRVLVFLVVVVGLCCRNQPESKEITQDTLIDEKVVEEPDISEYRKTTGRVDSTTDVEQVSTETEKREPQNAVPVKKPKPKKKKKKSAVITFDSLVYQLPDLIEGEEVHHDVHFTNTGDAPLSITYVRPSCGCTQPSFPFLDIAPGDSGVIGVDYHSVGKDGPQEAQLTVTSNAIPKESIVTLKVNVSPRPKQQDTLSN